MMRIGIAAVGLAGLLTIAAGSVTAARAFQTPDRWRTFLSVDQINMACAQIAVDDRPSANRLRPWCNLRLDLLPFWDGEMLSSRPTIADVVEMASAYAQSRQPGDTARVGPPSTNVNVTVAPGQTPAGPTLAVGGVLTQGEILLGLTDFLLDEARDQLAGWAVPAMYRTLCDPTQDAPLHWLFPSTCGTLANSKATNLVAAPKTAFESVRADLRVMPLRVMDYALAADSMPDRHREALLYGRLVYAGVSNLTREPLSLAAVAAALDSLSVPDSLCAGSTTVCNRVKGQLDTLQTNVRLLHQFLGPIDPSRLTDGTVWMEAVRAFILNTHLRENGLEDTTLTQLARRLHRLSDVRHHLIGASNALQHLKAMPRGTTPGDESTGDQERAAGSGDERARRLELYIDFMEHVVGVVQGMMELSESGDTVTFDPTLVRQLLTTVGAFGAQDYARGMVSLIAVVRRVGLDSLLPPTGTRILTFAAEMSEASTAEDVATALREFSQAAVARRNKRAEKNPGGVSVQGYAGLFGGGEAIDQFSDAPFAGVYGAVGVELTIPVCHCGIFFQVIDLGALFSARLSGTDSEDTVSIMGDSLRMDNTVATVTRMAVRTSLAERVTDLKFEHVFAPGAYLTYAIPDTPLSFGFGAALTPDLRSIEDTFTLVGGDAAGAGIDFGDKLTDPLKRRQDGWRFGAFVAVDIPIFP